MDGWEKYQELVLHELKQHSNSLNKIQQDIGFLKGEVKVLKIKSGLWGVFGGLLTLFPIAVVILVKFF